MAVPVRGVDVALFRNLPGAGTPLVSAAADKTLGTMDPIAAALSKLETKGPAMAQVAGGARLAGSVRSGRRPTAPAAPVSGRPPW